jgi:hypothetical protein
LLALHVRIGAGAVNENMQARAPSAAKVPA